MSEGYSQSDDHQRTCLVLPANILITALPRNASSVPQKPLIGSCRKSNCIAIKNDGPEGGSIIIERVTNPSKKLCEKIKLREVIRRRISATSMQLNAEVTDIRSSHPNITCDTADLSCIQPNELCRAIRQIPSDRISMYDEYFPGGHLVNRQPHSTQHTLPLVSSNQIELRDNELYQLDARKSNRDATSHRYRISPDHSLTQSSRKYYQPQIIQEETLELHAVQPDLCDRFSHNPNTLGANTRRILKPLNESSYPRYMSEEPYKPDTRCYPPRESFTQENLQYSFQRAAQSTPKASNWPRAHNSSTKVNNSIPDRYNSSYQQLSHGSNSSQTSNSATAIPATLIPPESVDGFPHLDANQVSEFLTKSKVSCVNEEVKTSNDLYPVIESYSLFAMSPDSEVADSSFIPDEQVILKSDIPSVVCPFPQSKNVTQFSAPEIKRTKDPQNITKKLDKATSSIDIGGYSLQGSAKEEISNRRIDEFDCTNSFGDHAASSSHVEKIARNGSPVEKNFCPSEAAISSPQSDTLEIAQLKDLAHMISASNKQQANVIATSVLKAGPSVLKHNMSESTKSRKTSMKRSATDVYLKNVEMISKSVKPRKSKKTTWVKVTGLTNFKSNPVKRRRTSKATLENYSSEAVVLSKANNDSKVLTQDKSLSSHSKSEEQLIRKMLPVDASSAMVTAGDYKNETVDAPAIRPHPLKKISNRPVRAYRSKSMKNSINHPVTRKYELKETTEELSKSPDLEMQNQAKSIPSDTVQSILTTEVNSDERCSKEGPRIKANMTPPDIIASMKPDNEMTYVAKDTSLVEESVKSGKMKHFTEGASSSQPVYNNNIQSQTVRNIKNSTADHNSPVSKQNQAKLPRNKASRKRKLSNIESDRLIPATKALRSMRRGELFGDNQKKAAKTVISQINIHGSSLSKEHLDLKASVDDKAVKDTRVLTQSASNLESQTTVHVIESESPESEDTATKVTISAKSSLGIQQCNESSLDVVKSFVQANYEHEAESSSTENPVFTTQGTESGSNLCSQIDNSDISGVRLEDVNKETAESPLKFHVMRPMIIPSCEPIKTEMEELSASSYIHIKGSEADAKPSISPGSTLLKTETFHVEEDIKPLVSAEYSVKISLSVPPSPESQSRQCNAPPEVLDCSTSDQHHCSDTSEVKPMHTDTDITGTRKEVIRSRVPNADCSSASGETINQTVLPEHTKCNESSSDSSIDTNTELRKNIPSNTKPDKPKSTASNMRPWKFKLNSKNKNKKN